MKGTCHCGAVRIEVRDRPSYLNLCNCSLCFKLGAMWGYYPIAEVSIEGPVRRYTRADTHKPELHLNFCDACGATTHWSRIGAQSHDRTAINMRLFEFSDLSGVEVRYGNRRDYDRIDPQPSYREPSVFQPTGATA
jgi:hypothetical protein